MIEKEVREVCELLDFKGTLDITISVPKGKELAERTFNPKAHRPPLPLFQSSHAAHD